MKIGILLLARMGSTRLPGKVLLDVEGKPVLGHVVDRLRRVTQAAPVVVATTDNPRDDAIVAYCRDNAIDWYRGSEENIVARCIRCAEAFGLQAIVRVGADSPFIDWLVIDDMVECFAAAASGGAPLDYVTNSMERSFPLGLDADVMTVAVLHRLQERYRGLPDDERTVCENNVVPHLHQFPHRFRIHSHRQISDHSHLRWTLDTPEDFALVRKVYRALYAVHPAFRMSDILALLRVHPEWVRINSGVVPRTGYWTETEKTRWRERFGTACRPH